MSHPLCYTLRMKEIKNMKMKMKLTKNEQKFIAENIQKFDVVWGSARTKLNVADEEQHEGCEDVQPRQ